MEASRPTRLCRWGSTNIKPADSRYDRGTSGGQVNPPTRDAGNICLAKLAKRRAFGKASHVHAKSVSR